MEKTEGSYMALDVLDREECQKRAFHEYPLAPILASTTSRLASF